MVTLFGDGFARPHLPRSRWLRRGQRTRCEGAVRDKLPGRPRPATAAGWTTVKKEGTTEWNPVPDRAQRRTNTYSPPKKCCPTTKTTGTGTATAVDGGPRPRAEPTEASSSSRVSLPV